MRVISKKSFDLLNTLDSLRSCPGEVKKEKEETFERVKRKGVLVETLKKCERKATQPKERERKNEYG